MSASDNDGPSQSLGEFDPARASKGRLLGATVAKTKPRPVPRAQASLALHVHLPATTGPLASLVVVWGAVEKHGSRKVVEEA
jgi:hypothetical protein